MIFSPPPPGNYHCGFYSNAGAGGVANVFFQKRFLKTFLTCLSAGNALSPFEASAYLTQKKNNRQRHTEQGSHVAGKREGMGEEGDVRVRLIIIIFSKHAFFPLLLLLLALFPAKKKKKTQQQHNPNNKTTPNNTHTYPPITQNN